MAQSLAEMESEKEAVQKQKLENLFELFPHVNCDEVRDIFDGVSQNIQQAAATLKMIYGDRPEDLSDQFQIIDDVGDLGGNQEAAKFNQKDQFEVIDKQDF